MSFWTRIVSWLTPTQPTPRLAVNGHTLHWVSDPWPLAVYLDDSALEWLGEYFACLVHRSPAECHDGHSMEQDAIVEQMKCEAEMAAKGAP